MIKVIETEKGFRLEATTKRDQKVLSITFQPVPSDATFRIENAQGDMAHCQWIEFGYEYKPPRRVMEPSQQQD